MASISNFRNMQAENKMLILGDMRELGKDSADEHQKIADYLEECGFKDVVLVGELFAATRHPLSELSRCDRTHRRAAKGETLWENYSDKRVERHQAKFHS